MSRALRFLAILFALLCGALPARAAQDAALERGTAIIDPAGAARTRRRTIWPRPHAAAGAVGGYPAHQRRSCSRCRRWRRSGRRSTASSTAISQGTRRACRTRRIGVGDGFDFQLFDRALLYSPRYALRAGRHRQPHGPRLCRRGKLRRNPADLPPDADQRAATGDDAALAAAADDAERRAEGERRSRDRSRRQAITCAEIARRWLAAGDLSLTGAELAAKLIGRMVRSI